MHNLEFQELFWVNPEVFVFKPVAPSEFINVAYMWGNQN